MIKLLENFPFDYIVFNWFCIVRTNVFRCFLNKINFVWRIYLFIYFLAMKSLWKSMFEYFYNEWIWFLVMLFMEMSRIYQIGRVSHRPKFQSDRNLESCNLVAWWMRNSYLEIRPIRWQSVKWRTRRSSTQSSVLIKFTIRITKIFVMTY